MFIIKQQKVYYLNNMMKEQNNQNIMEIIVIFNLIKKKLKKPYRCSTHNKDLIKNQRNKIIFIIMYIIVFKIMKFKYHMNKKLNNIKIPSKMKLV